jgi:hypothetical protein
VKDRQNNIGENIYLYCAQFEHMQLNYQLLGLLQDMRLVLGTHIVYALVKRAKTYVQIRYCFKMINYNMEEGFIELCAFIV